MNHRRTSRCLFACTASTVLLLVSACSSDEPEAVAKDEPVATGGTPSTTPSPAEPEPDVLAGTWATPPITLARIKHVALQAGFAQKDVDDLMAGFGGARQVVYTLKLEDGFWVEFEQRDDAPAQDGWAGPYEVLDGTTVRAGEPPCGPITYAYELEGDQLRLDMTEDRCFLGEDEVDVGELIAQTTIYESAPFRRIG